ncbi:UDP-glycosyltransferase UGT5-like [Periplaneta americana]|uniref:UDP-glycosyltransferase UGT5-like n=1 Tax=Periplaneta americana TaxID=6978 RepID=UPI0037E91747
MKDIIQNMHSLQKFLDEAKDGVILFCLGTWIRSDLLKEKVQVFLDAFSELSQRVLWKLDTERLPGQPPNVLISKWLPQSDILAHPNVRLFITHCGRMSMIETVYRGVPVVGVPLFADQFSVLTILQSRGAAVGLDYPTLTKESILVAVREVLNNESYKINMKQLSKLVKDQPDDPLDRAVFWTEYVIRHKGAEHLRPASTDLYWHQYLLLDVLMVLTVGLLMVVMLTYLTVKRIYRILKSLAKAKTD